MKSLLLFAFRALISLAILFDAPLSLKVRHGFKYSLWQANIQQIDWDFQNVRMF